VEKEENEEAEEEEEEDEGKVQVGCRNLTRPSHLPQHPKKRFAFLSCSHIFRIQSCHHWLRNVVQSLKLEIITFGCRLTVLT